MMRVAAQRFNVWHLLYMVRFDRESASPLRLAVALLCCIAIGCGSNAPPPAVAANTRAAEQVDEDELMPDLRDIAKLTEVCEGAEESMDAAVACFALAGLIDAGLIAQEQVRERALRMRGHALVVRACKRGDGEACSFRGGLFARRLEQLDPGSARAQEVAAEALTTLDRACVERQGLACTLIGIIHERGMGVAADLARAKRFYRNGCALEHAAGCLRVAQLIWQLDDPTDDVTRMRRARDAYARSCETGSLDGCEWAGYLFVAGLGGLTQDLQGAFPHYKKACEGDRANACMRLGVIYARRGARQHALGAFGRACDQGEARACELVGKDP